MVNPIKENSLPHRMLMIGLMVISTLLFGIGIALERAGEANEPADTHAEIGGEHEEGNDTEAEHEEENVVEAPHTETILGIDIENPLFVIGAIGVWAALTLGLWLFGRRILVPIIVVAVGTALFDAAEVVTQINRSNTGIALLAALITILHLAVAALACRILLSQTSTQTNVSSSQI